VQRGDAETRWPPLDLGPNLPMPLYISGQSWQAERIRAVTMYCSDGRWGEAFDEFCHHSLHIPRYDRLALPGGPAWLVREEAHIASARPMLQSQLDFLVRVHELERVVLITHFACAFYAELLPLDPYQMLGFQVADVRRALERITTWFPHLEVEGYLAMREGQRLTFRPVED
jgi:hypothetical protein